MVPPWTPSFSWSTAAAQAELPPGEARLRPQREAIVELPRREDLSLTSNEAVGPYTLLKVERGGLEPGNPGQFFMLEAPGRLLPRPMSLCLAPPGELAFLLDPIGPGTQALASLEPGGAIHVYGPLGNGFRLDVARPLLVGGGIGIAPLPYLSQKLGSPPAVLGFRSEWHAEAASLVPNADVVIDPVLVTEALRGRLQPVPAVLACGPERMLEAVRAIAPDAQLAWEAPMACGYGACYGCAVEIEGEWKRLCIEGPVLGPNGHDRGQTPAMSGLDEGSHG
jgi:dihydroorotate dehydrogenase electron transfer subunit